MFATKVGESCSTTGTGSFSLSGAYGAFRTWRSGFANGTQAFYLATNDAGTIWEAGYGDFTTGLPDTLSRTLLASSSGALISWATTPYRVYNLPSAEAMALVLAPLINGVAAVPAWLPAGALWIDYSLGIATAWVMKRYISGARTSAASHAEEGRFYLGLSGGVANIFAASQRTLFVDKGAASYTFTADDVGKVLAFNTTAAVRTLTMPAASTAGIGHGAYVFVYPYSTTAVSPNGVTFTPGGSDSTTLATAPANRITKFAWDGDRSKWVTDYVPPPATVYAKGTIAELTYQNAAADVTNDIDIAAGSCMDATGAVLITLTALTKQLDAAWAVGSAAGGLDTGSIANTDYAIWAIMRPDTGVADALFSTSFTSPTMPANYTYKRLIGYIKRSGGAIVLFKTTETAGGGIKFMWTTPREDISLSNTLGASRRTDALSVPTAFAVDAMISASQYDTAGIVGTRIMCPDEADRAVYSTDGSYGTGAAMPNLLSVNATVVAVGEMTVRTSATGTIASRSNTASIDTFKVQTNGFIWSRR